MNFVFRSAIAPLLVAFSASGAHALPNVPDLIPAQGGAIRITPIYHASMQIEYRGMVIQVDPFSQGDYTGAKKADYILVTHSHPDHFDLKAISALAGPRLATIVAPPAVVQKMPASLGHLTLSNGNYATLTKNGVIIRVDAAPAYNIVRGPKPGQKFHPQGEFNGYVLTMGGKRIYISGDTEATPAMKALKNIDVAFVCMNLPYTMTPQEAAQGVKAFKPKIVYPYHYRYPFTTPNSTPQQFQNALKGSGIQVRLRPWYAHPAA